MLPIRILFRRTSVWLMEPMLEPRKMELLDRVRRTELDVLSKATFLAR